MPLGPDDVRLDDRVAIVTGAAAGIGRATAVALARFGADVAICDRDADQLAAAAAEVQTTGRRALPGVLDVRDQGQVSAWLGEVADTFGHVDVLVNNAGGGFRAAFLDVNDKGQDALVRENFTSVTSFIRGAVPLMPETGGSIVNVTSIEAHRAGPGFAVYSAMKAAQANLTKSLALELGPRMVRVNCVAPDVIPTPGIGADMGVRTPLPRAGHVDDIAAAVVFLANPALSGFVTGTTIHVDGGNRAAGGWHRQPDGSYST
jgi:NAD(P)-dependent dehydrogenase (short-subunit alcohol dehydrogenase family)